MSFSSPRPWAFSKKGVNKNEVNFFVVFVAEDSKNRWKRQQKHPHDEI